MSNVSALKNLAAVVCGVEVTAVPGNTNAEVIQFMADNYGDSGTLGTLTVSSVAGTASGKTKITVTPAIAGGNTYAYKTSASTIPTPDYLSTPTDTTAWDGTSEITADDGHKIGIYELNSAGKVVKFGTTTIHTNLG